MFELTEIIKEEAWVVRDLRDRLVVQEERRRLAPVSAEDPVVRQRLAEMILGREADIRRQALNRLRTDLPHDIARHPTAAWRVGDTI